MTGSRGWIMLSSKRVSHKINLQQRQSYAIQFKVKPFSTSSRISSPTSSSYPPPEPLPFSSSNHSLSIPSFTAPPSAFSTFGCDPELLSHFLSLPPRPLTFNALISLGRGPQLRNSLNSKKHYVHSPPNILQSASFTRRELPIRLARRVGAFRNLPFIVGSNPYVQKIARLYAESFETLARFEEIKDEESNARYTGMLESLVSDHAQNVPTLARGFLECKKYMAPRDVSAFLDATIHSRIGIRLIAEQHLSLSSSASFPSNSNSNSNTSPPSKESNSSLNSKKDSQNSSHTLTDPSSVGVLSLSLSASNLIKTCASFVSELCEGTLGKSPELWLEGDVDATYVGVPVHLEYVMTEVLKNSYRATAERWGSNSSSPMPPVKVTISKSKNHLSIRVRDQGGGISPKNLPHVFSYAFTTASSEEDELSGNLNSPTEIDNSNQNQDFGPYSLQSGSGMSNEDEDTIGLLGNNGQNGLSSGLGTLAGLGYGLPMARIYATYFGAGSRLEVVSLWGHGCDTFIKLPANVLTIE